MAATAKIMHLNQVQEPPGVQLADPPGYKPDDDMLAQDVVKQLDGRWRFFRSFWHEYVGGVWQRRDDIFTPILDVLRRNRNRGIHLNKGKMQSVEFFTQLELKLRDESLVDNVGNYLNFTNGMLNLETMELEEHRQDAYLTTQLDFAYVDDDHCPEFENFIEGALVTPETHELDWRLVCLMQELIGYSLASERSQRVSAWLYGESNTGKSTLLNLLISILKPLHEAVDLNQLGDDPYLLGKLPGKRLVTCAEIEPGMKLDVAAYKLLVSSDPITANLKYRDPISFVPACVVWWGMNHMPIIPDRTEAMFNRVKVIPFNRVIPTDKRDFSLPDKLYAERAQIVSWALQGYQRLRATGKFTECEQVTSLIQDFRDETDFYRAFLNDPDTVRREGEIRPLELYRAFRMWCEDRGIQKFASERTIGREWRRLGLKQKQSGGRFWQGVSIAYGAKKF